jgi:hypothetical protein
VKLISLKLTARGVNGWESPLLTFGDRTTSLHAPNGSGKTPIVQAIPFCLGFDTKFQNDIREKCQTATLAFEHGGHTYSIQRDFGDFHIATGTGGSVREFFNEADFSMALFETLDLPMPTLVGTNRQATQPYVSSLLPIFYVRQIGGYDEPYRPPASFISDQFVEMIRFAFGLSPKHSYTAKRDLLEARERLELDQRRLVFQQKVVADIAANVDDSPETRNRMTRQAEALTEQIRSLRDSVDVAGAANDALLELLQAKEERMRTLRRRHADLRARVSGIESIRAEIEGEIKTLSLNEESKRVFESFFDICSRADCGLFVSSSASYAKNLMYLKDQIKDLESNEARAGLQLELLSSRLDEEDLERQTIASKMQQSGQGTTGHLVSAVQSLTRELLEVEQRLIAINRLVEEKSKYVKFDEERARTQDRIATLSNKGQSDFEFNKLRATVRDLTVKWMDILDTPNAPREVDIDLDFKFRFGKQTVDVFNGSTRSRLILAIHAAIFEHYLEDPDRPFRFLILDTPKQQELASHDLAKYLGALEDVCDKSNGQILISATEYHHVIGERDVEWLPRFPGEKRLMYLGSPGQANGRQPS